MNVIINLTEGNFPININNTYEKSILDHINLNQDIFVDIVIEKPSLNILFAKGIIKTQINDKCESCFKKLNYKININTNIEIQDEKLSMDRVNRNKDIHFQNISEFDIKELIKEEIYLNIPSIMLCEEENCITNKEAQKEQLARPFKKIRDLIR